MVKTFHSKTLEKFYFKGNRAGLPQERVEKIRKILAVINAAKEVRDLDVPAFRLHQLKKPPYIGFWSIDLSGNFRIIFRFEGGDAYEIDLQDTH